MFYSLTSREQIVQYLPPGGTAAEIGVAQGDFAAVLLAATSPRELHLIDPWSHLETETLGGFETLKQLANDPNAHATPPPANSAGDAQFQAVTRRFASEPRVRLHRQYSYRLAQTFSDAFFDYVYLDGNHTYEFVLRDLLDFAPKVKPDGLILGHDFFRDEFADRENYGVIPAVQTFLRRSGYQFLALTCEPFSSFVLAKEVRGFAASFLERLLNSNTPLVRLPVSLSFNYHDQHFRLSNGMVRRIPTFG